MKQHKETIHTQEIRWARILTVCTFYFNISLIWIYSHKTHFYYTNCIWHKTAEKHIKYMLESHFSISWNHVLLLFQCRNLRIFLSFWFYVKTILKNLDVLKMSHFVIIGLLILFILHPSKSAKISWKSKHRASVKMADFALLEFPKLISREISEWYDNHGFSMLCVEIRNHAWYPIWRNH